MRWQAPSLAAGRARLVGLRPPLTDVLLAAGVLVIAQVETWMTTSFQPKVPLALVAAAMTVPLAWRRRAPFGALVAVGVAGAVLGTGWPELNALYSFIAVVMAVFSVGAYAEPRRAVLGCALVLVWFWAGALIDNARHPGRRGPSDAVFVTVVFGGVWLLGRALRGRGSGPPSWSSARPSSRPTSRPRPGRRWRPSGPGSRGSCTMSSPIRSASW
jgi:hypothetical protein